MAESVLLHMAKQSEPHGTAIVQALVPAIAIPILTALGIWIAYQQMRTARNQWQTSQNKLKLDLFDRRMTVYQAARDAIGEMFSSGKSLSREAQTVYLTQIQPAKWLFGPEVVTYVEETLWHYIVEFELVDAMAEGSIKGDAEYVAFVHRRAEYRKALSSHYRLLDEKFGPYMKLEH